VPRFVRTQQIDHTIGAEGLLELRVTAADVRIQPVDGDVAHVRATFQIRAYGEPEADRIYEQVQLRVDASSRALRVTERDAESGIGRTLQRLFGGDRAELDIEVEVPAGAELQLATVTGDVQATGLRGHQRYTTVSGDLYLVDTAGDIRVKSVSGDATIRGIGPITGQAEAVSGDLVVSAPLLEGLRSSSVSGDVTVDGELSPSGDFRVETVSGDLAVGLRGSAIFEVRGISTEISSPIDHRIEGRLDRRRVVIGSGGPEFVFSSMSGDISIRRSARLVPSASTPATPRRTSHPSDAGQLAILRALEQGEIDVDEASRRLAEEGSSDA
jgi:Toastrack DUF4097